MDVNSIEICKRITDCVWWNNPKQISVARGSICSCQLSHSIVTPLLSAQCFPTNPPEKAFATNHVQRRDPKAYAQYNTKLLYILIRLLLKQCNPRVSSPPTVLSSVIRLAFAFLSLQCEKFAQSSSDTGRLVWHRWPFAFGSVLR